MARICGICPVSHLIASSKACDALLAVQHSAHRRQAAPDHESRADHAIPRAQLFLSLFARSALGHGCRPGAAQIFGVLAQHPEMARDGIRLRSIGQQIIEMLGGKRIHPGLGGAWRRERAITAEKREQMLAMLPEAGRSTLRALEWFKGALAQYQEEIASFANFPSLFMGLVNDERYPGAL